MRDCAALSTTATGTARPSQHNKHYLSTKVIIEQEENNIITCDELVAFPCFFFFMQVRIVSKEMQRIGRLIVIRFVFENVFIFHFFPTQSRKVSVKMAPFSMVSVVFSLSFYNKCHYILSCLQYSLSLCVINGAIFAAFLEWR